MNIGYLDLTAQNINPLTLLPYENPSIYIQYAKEWSNFPMYNKADEILTALSNNQVILIKAGTGQGKSVLTPKFLLHYFNYKSRIIITNPKAEVTVNNATYQSKLMDVRLGEEIGYVHSKDKNFYNIETNRLLYTTDGWIESYMMSDSLLSKFDCLLIDEVHERNIRIDFLLMLVKKILIEDPNFRLVLVSATLDEELFSDYYKEFNFKTLKYNSPPLYLLEEIFWQGDEIYKVDEKNNQKIININTYQEWMAKRIMTILALEKADIIGFVNSKNEAKKICELIEQIKNKEKFKILTNSKNPLCIPLDAKSNEETKNIAITKNDYIKIYPNSTSKIVLGTELIESSITIDGAKYIIDNGTSMTNVYYPSTDIDSLEFRLISKASHLQRKGRVGRNSDGICYNLFTKEFYEKNFLDYNINEIQKTNLSDRILKFLQNEEYSVGFTILPFSYENRKYRLKNDETKINLEDLFYKLIDKPSENRINDMLNKFKFLGLIERFEPNSNVFILSNIGLEIQHYNCQKVESYLLLYYANIFNCLNQMAIIVALLENAKYQYREIFSKEAKKQFPTQNELYQLYFIYYEYKNLDSDYKSKWLAENFLNSKVFDNIETLIEDKKYNIPITNTYRANKDDNHDLERAIYYALRRNIAYRKDKKYINKNKVYAELSKQGILSGNYDKICYLSLFNQNTLNFIWCCKIEKWFEEEFYRDNNYNL